jgi:mannose-1-phosphate guanylyltransferase
VEAREPEQNRWAIILAGGEGRRVADRSCRIADQNTPRQFCRMVDNQSLVEHTRQRVELAIPKDRILYTLNRSHERYYVPLLFDVLLARLVVQPESRGTAPAILYALMRLGLADPNAHVALFPCDHWIGGDRLFMRRIQAAFDVIDEGPEHTVVLGVAPSTAELGKGWIEPASHFRCKGETLFHVRRFIEEPPIEAACGMHTHGRVLRNSLVLVARLPNLLALVIRALPELYDLFAEFSGTLGTEFESHAAEKIYRAIEPRNFWKSVLSTQARDQVSVLPVSAL